MYELITNKRYYWLGLSEDISDILRDCEFCQKYKKDNQQHKQPMQITDVASYPFEKIAIDVVDMSQIQTQRGSRYIISIHDNLTCFVYLKAAKQHRALEVANAIIN